MTARTKAADVQAARRKVEAAELELDIARAELRVAQATAAKAPEPVVAELAGHVERLQSLRG